MGITPDRPCKCKGGSKHKRGMMLTRVPERDLLIGIIKSSLIPLESIKQGGLENFSKRAMREGARGATTSDKEGVKKKKRMWMKGQSRTVHPNKALKTGVDV